MFALRFPLSDLYLQLRTTGLHPVTRLDHMSNLSLKTTHFCIGFVQGTLCSMHRIARRIMRLPARLKRSLARAQPRRRSFKLSMRALDILLCAVALFLGSGLF